MSQTVTRGASRVRGWPRWKKIIAISALVLIPVFTALALLITSLLGNSEVAQLALTRARTHPAVVQMLGAPIEQGWGVTGKLSYEGPSGRAELALSISGPKGNGTLYVTADRSAGEWSYEKLEYAPAGGGPRIDILTTAAINGAQVQEPPVTRDVRASDEAVEPAPTGAGSTSATLRSGVRNFYLTSEKASAFGQFKRASNPVYKVGDTIFVYGEPVNLGWFPDKGAYRFAVAIDFELRRPDGQVVMGKRDAMAINLEAAVPRSDLYMNLRFETRPVPPGSYILALQVREATAKRGVVKTFPIEIVATANKDSAT